ncbi:MAG TPA: histidinol phosphate phosphatase domain-containing protein, partial [Thermoplasmata archaeon]|nr:histidinol phosphate phosphatase domain-containing protein [Thermoplasmata archaeon]
MTDGQNSATDLWHEAELLGHAALAVTDHVGLNDPRPLLERLRSEARGWEGSGMVTLVGVEVTHVRPDKIAGVVRAARRAGAEIVLVHGETLAEHVLPGTNRAALETGEVDVLAHPGLLSIEDAELARAQGTLLEISSRPGHSLANGLVVRRAIEVGARMVVDS